VDTALARTSPWAKDRRVQAACRLQPGKPAWLLVNKLIRIKEVQISSLDLQAAPLHFRAYA
jgi:hypothetical protein